MTQTNQCEDLCEVKLPTVKFSLVHAMALLHVKRLIELSLKMPDCGEATGGVFVSALALLDLHFNFPALEAMEDRYQQAFLSSESEEA